MKPISELKVDPIAKNLRCFYGVNAVKVWSSYRDFQRAERSIAVYSKVMEGLKEDLKLEQGRRGTLVRLRSNEVTEVKEKLSEVEAEKNLIMKQKREKESGIDTFLGRMEVRLKSLFGVSESIEKINEAISEDLKKSQKLEKEIEDISKELSDAVFKQNAAIDPIEDLEFALEYLENEIDNCRERQRESRDFINGHTTRKCMEGGPLILDLFVHSGLVLEDSLKFSELYLKIHEEALEICSIPQGREALEPNELLTTVHKGFEEEVIDVKGNVKLTGTGTHHRKVRRGKSRVWRQFAVYFDGTTSVHMGFDQNTYNSNYVRDALSNQAVYDFNSGRNFSLEKVDRGKEQKLNTLRQYSSMLFEQLIHN